MLNCPSKIDGRSNGRGLAQRDVPDNRLSRVALGQSRPIAPKTRTPDQSALNRRFQISDQFGRIRTRVATSPSQPATPLTRPIDRYKRSRQNS